MSVFGQNAFIRYGTVPCEPNTIVLKRRNANGLASETLDVDVREALIELASDYERQAQRLEEQWATKSQLRE